LIRYLCNEEGGEKFPSLLQNPGFYNIAGLPFHCKIVYEYLNE